MKNTIPALLITTMLISCNLSDKTKNPVAEPSDTETMTETAPSDDKKQLKPIETDEDLVATALMATPKASRADCTVIGYNMAGEFTTLKEGSNEFIVLADNPKKNGFNAACYHKDLEPFMARGRALREEGKNSEEIFNIREDEMKSGKLTIPTGATLHIYYGEQTMYDPETSEVEGAKLRYVVYMPWATAASTGLPEIPAAPNHPWIMNPGTHRAHIMISPLPSPQE
ncbi:hypothetical protein J8L85_15735 [Maribacter sp. MMG018]|uniref:hypothetical protein n=1 Tax=Maribacter sp. MMG018 TaxID=2822688 RepID=UPI001B36978F|nr:hypothetical protein [Maribacter sp. MMG018]MBQ4915907.1 hypothetical protein [Maribacter sp. MMG018]